MGVRCNVKFSGAVKDLKITAIFPLNFEEFMATASRMLRWPDIQQMQGAGWLTMTIWADEDAPIWGRKRGETLFKLVLGMDTKD